MYSYKRQSGFITIQLGICVLVIGVLFTAWAVHARNESLRQLAQSVGTQAGQVNNAIRAYIAEYAALTPSGTYSNLNWLKQSGECPAGTGARGFLPCDFPEQLDLGLYYSITVTNSAGRIRSVMDLGIPSDGAESLAYLSGAVVSGARGADVLSIAPGVGNTYFTAQDDKNGHIQLTASNDPADDLYLRKDGTVKPTADFDWNNYRLDNVKGLSVNEDVKVQGSLIDSEDTDYKVKPSDKSKLDYVEANLVKLASDQVIGDACETKTIGTTTQGQLLECKNGIWTPALDQLDRYWRSYTATERNQHITYRNNTPYDITVSVSSNAGGPYNGCGLSIYTGASASTMNIVYQSYNVNPDYSKTCGGTAQIPPGWYYQADFKVWNKPGGFVLWAEYRPVGY